MIQKFIVRVTVIMSIASFYLLINLFLTVLYGEDLTFASCCAISSHILPIAQRQPPTLPKLIQFKTRSGSINILEQIGLHYEQLGVLLLEDTTGAVTEAIIKHSHDATEINLHIFKQWIQGKGKKPIEWSTLIEVLIDIGLPVLATEMEHALK